METLINRFRELSRNTQIAIIISVCVFTPIVGTVFGIIGFILGFVKWSVAIPMLLIFAGYKAYNVVFNDNNEEDEEEEYSFDPFA